MYHPKQIIHFETLDLFIFLCLLVSHYKPVCHIVCPEMSKLDLPDIKGKQKKIVYEDITFMYILILYLLRTQNKSTFYHIFRS